VSSILLKEAHCFFSTSVYHEQMYTNLFALQISVYFSNNLCLCTIAQILFRQ